MAIKKLGWLDSYLRCVVELLKSPDVLWIWKAVFIVAVITLIISCLATFLIPIVFANNYQQQTQPPPTQNVLGSDDVSSKPQVIVVKNDKIVEETTTVTIVKPQVTRSESRNSSTITINENDSNNSHQTKNKE